MTKKKPIEIAPEHKGLFTAWCKKQGHKSVTCACIKEGLAAGGNRARQANFARNFGNQHCNKGK